ncbi:hypothetical protein [Streptomyces sp. NPDC048606]|uniref:hypothetical protein n=1 Tax=Streptomyces sp. NPDC048606 TaxID=3154726 RepID=UPI003433FA29
MRTGCRSSRRPAPPCARPSNAQTNHLLASLVEARQRGDAAADRAHTEALGRLAERPNVAARPELRQILLGVHAYATTPRHLATPGRDIQLSEISGGRWRFYTPMGKSAGKTAQQCLQGAQGDVLPAEIEAKDLRTTVPVGTLLCTVTSDRRLAMLDVTDITTSKGNLPDYATRLTLWQRRWGVSSKWRRPSARAAQT